MIPAGRGPTGEASAGRPGIARPELPAWPFLGLFYLFPLWWLLGLAPFAVIGFGLIALALMVRRGGILLPPGWLTWVAFLTWAMASLVRIDTAGRMIGFGQRWVALLGVSLLLVYLYNAPGSLPRRRALGGFAVFGVWLICGGYLGMIFPNGRVSTPLASLLPGSIAANEYVHELINPRFAEVQNPYGAAEAFVRPSAPFPYTNAWGQAFVLLLPVALALAVRASWRGRLLLGAGILVALPPALATLNRGIFIGVSVAALYLAARLARRATLSHVLAGLGIVGGAGAVLVLGGALAKVGERTTTSSTTADRASLYLETLRRTLQSPLVGWGAPRPSETLQVSVGTQGHLWYLMFSHGFVGMSLFVITLWATVLRTRRVRELEPLLMHTIPVCLSVTMLFYGVDPLHLLIALGCAVLLTRPEAPRWRWTVLPALPRSPQSSRDARVSIESP